MNKKTKNIISSIIGLIMLLISIYMFIVDMDLLHCITVFVLGLGLFYSYSKLAEILTNKLKI